MIKCEQCAVWQGREVAFASIEEAEQHLINVHPSRLLAQYQQAQHELAEYAVVSREEVARAMMEARKG